MIGKTARTAIWLGALAVLPVCHASLGNALIVEDGVLGNNAEGFATTNLTNLLTTAGYVVTTNAGVPAGSLASYHQIWDIRYDVTLSGSDINAYITYLGGGGHMFVMGENTTDFQARDTSMASLVQFAGGGTLTFAAPVFVAATPTYTAGYNPQTVQGVFSTTPNSVPSFNYAVAGGVSSPPGTGAFISVDTNHVGSAVVFGPGTLANASTGSLEIVFDVDFLEPQLNVTDPNSQRFTVNLIQYLSAPNVPPPPPSPSASVGAPALSEWGILLLACGLAVVAARRLRVPAPHAK
jgi:hypothetical protein